MSEPLRVVGGSHDGRVYTMPDKRPAWVFPIHWTAYGSPYDWNVLKPALTTETYDRSRLGNEIVLRYRSPLTLK